MTPSNAEGVRLEFSSGRPSITNLAEINQALGHIGAHIWPLELRGTPVAIQQLLDQPTLNDAEVAAVQEHFLLSRERLLGIIAEASRTAQVPGGGEMSTFDATNGVAYPQLYIVEAGVDYTRFDRFHTNSSNDGPGVDEVMQVLSGGGVRVLQHLPEEGVITLQVDCVADEHGWIVTYDGGYPHIGSISGGRPGTKVLVQVIGPARWEMRYENET